AVKAPQVRIFQSAPSSPQKSNDGEILLPLRGIRISPAGSLPRGGITPARPLKFKSAPPDRLPLQVVGSIGIPLPLCGIGISPAGSRSPASRDPLTPANRLKRDPSLRSGFRLRAPALPLRRTRSRPQNGSRGILRSAQDFACGLPLSRFAGPAHARKTAQEGSFAPLRISPAGSRSPASRDPLTPAKRLKFALDSTGPSGTSSRARSLAICASQGFGAREISDSRTLFGGT